MSNISNAFRTTPARPKNLRSHFALTVAVYAVVVIFSLTGGITAANAFVTGESPKEFLTRITSGIWDTGKDQGSEEELILGAEVRGDDESGKGGADNLEESAPTPKAAQQTLLPTETSKETIIRPQTYSVIPMGDFSSFPERDRVLWTDAYSEFLQTPNLRYMDYDQQNDYFLQIVEKYYIQYKAELEAAIRQEKENLADLRELIDTYEQQNQADQENEDIFTPTPIPQNPVYPDVEAALAELRQTLQEIEGKGKGVAMNVIEGRKYRAYRDWVEDNFEIFTQIQSSHYAAQLNTILTIYGLN